jgi:hypothetical protein
MFNIKKKPTLLSGGGGGKGKTKKSAIVPKSKFALKCHHVIPKTGCDATLEGFALHVELGGYAERGIAEGFFQRTIPSHMQFLEKTQFHTHVEKLTNGNGIVLKNEKDFDIRLFVRPIPEQLIGQFNGPVIKRWIEEILIPEVRNVWDELTTYNTPSFDPVTDYMVINHWSDVMGVRLDNKPRATANDILRLVKMDYYDLDVKHNFPTWIQNQANGNRFYSLFRPGFLTGEELACLNIPANLLEEVDRSSLDKYLLTVRDNEIEDSDELEDDINDALKPAAVETENDDTKPASVEYENDDTKPAHHDDLPDLEQGSTFINDKVIFDPLSIADNLPTDNSITHSKFTVGANGKGLHRAQGMTLSHIFVGDFNQLPTVPTHPSSVEFSNTASSDTSGSFDAKNDILFTPNKRIRDKAQLVTVEEAETGNEAQTPGFKSDDDMQPPKKRRSRKGA